MWLPLKWRHLRSLQVTWCHVMSFPVTWLPPPQSYSPVGAQTYPKLDLQHSTATSRSLLVKSCYFQIPWSHARSVTSFPVTTTSCKLQPCRSSNVPKTWLTGLLQPFPGDFRSNDVTSGSLPVTSGHMTSFPVTWLPPPVSYSPVGAQM